MIELVSGVRVVDLILVLLVVEGAFAIAFHRGTGRGIAPRDLLWNLLAGFALLLALRMAMISAGWHWIASCLALALVAHVADLWRRART